MCNPKISVIVPVYNVEKYLTRCIDSILTQTFTDYELLLIDDGSSDNSGKICDEYAKNDKRIRVFHKTNGGVSSARNTGIQEAKGDWLIFMDADDYFLDNAFPFIFNSISKYSDYYVLVAGFRVIYENGLEISRVKYKHDRILLSPLRSLWYRDFYSRPGNTIIRKDAFDTIGKYDEHLSYNEDLEFSIRLLSYYKPVILTKEIMAYVKTSGSASTFSHSYEKDFVSRIPYCSLNSIWEKLLTYSIFQFYKKKNKESKYVNGLRKSYSVLFNMVYIYHLIIRRIYLLLRS